MKSPAVNKWAQPGLSIWRVSERIRTDRESTLCVHHQCQQWGYAAPADVLVDIGVLPKQKYEDWRFGKVRYLEAVCTCNLKKLSFIMKQIRAYAKKSNLKPSFCYYKRWA